MSVPKSSLAGEPRQRVIRVAALARVEGEGALHLEMQGDQVGAVRLEIYEPPRFYEAFLRGRHFQEVPDITARICGICPVAYQMSSCHALEKALGANDRIPTSIARLRTLLYCGEWIESHVLHMFLLHLPDYLGFESAITMAESHGELVKRALRIKKMGNELLALLGGRAVHPVGVCVGGFYAVPRTEDARRLLPALKSTLDEMCEVVDFLASQVEFPRLERNYEFVSLYHDDEYPMNTGRIRSSQGWEVEQEEFLAEIEELHVPHSTALHAQRRSGGSYLVGPLARLNLCGDRLHPRAAEVLRRVCNQIRRPLPWNDNYLSLLARGVETVHALATAEDILGSYAPPEPPHVEIKPRAGVGSHGTEAPRGLCWHRYETFSDGMIKSARIIPPTSQNQAVIEEDLRLLAASLAETSDEEAALRCEHLIRNYDPCISCSVHFLKLHRTWVAADLPSPSGGEVR